MASRTRRTLVAVATDGTEVTEQTAGNYDVAGLIQHEDGRWVIVKHGYSRASVYDRTNALYNRGYYKQMCVANLTEETAPVVRQYFGTHQVTIESAYSAGSHDGLAENDMRAVLYAAGASLDRTSVARVAMSRPGEKGRTGIQVPDGIVSVSYADGKFTLEGVAPRWYFTGIQHTSAGRTWLRSLIRGGWTAVAFRHGDRVADFQADELLKSMNARGK